jgi:hypothetical protein
MFLKTASFIYFWRERGILRTKILNMFFLISCLAYCGFRIFVSNSPSENEFFSLERDQYGGHNSKKFMLISYLKKNVNKNAPKKDNPNKTVFQKQSQVPGKKVFVGSKLFLEHFF